MVTLMMSKLLRPRCLELNDRSPKEILLSGRHSYLSRVEPWSGVTSLLPWTLSQSSRINIFSANYFIYHLFCITVIYIDIYRI